MRRLLILASLMAATTSPAFGQGALWEGLSSGMTKTEVKAALPSNKVEIGQGCVVAVEPHYDGGKLDFIRIEGDHRKDGYPNRPFCGDVVRANLTAQYGEAQPVDASIDCLFYKGACTSSAVKSPLANAIGTAIDDSGNDYLSFTKEGVEVLFMQDRVQRFSYRMVYRPHGDAKIDPSMKL